MADRLRIEVLWSPAPRQVLEWRGELEAGSTVLDALLACELLPPGMGPAHSVAGIWGRKCRLDCVLVDGDRVEAYRPLVVDPKLARRERFRKQGVKTAGLFAQRRPGSKAGY